jgi:hypothetical protein
MPEALKRSPYQAPQTSMERHISTLVEKLEHGIDGRGGFNQAIEHAMSHAFWLETEYLRLAQDNRELENALAVGMPIVTASWDAGPILPTQMHTIDWQMDSIRFRALVRPFQSHADVKTWRRIRRSTFKQFIKRVRDQFDKTFPLNPFLTN